MDALGSNCWVDRLRRRALTFALIAGLLVDHVSRNSSAFYVVLGRHLWLRLSGLPLQGCRCSTSGGLDLRHWPLLSGAWGFALRDVGR